ncbi:hypothetical protein BV25DRAFT_1587939 [Artomyces pyxidatus]|uniref:Uncharacterized protein n=1 Tax=Artomyces pyxidatus TaxID=48021 RepID=A0ACB8TBL3_9AGAM|nr:hypothetical protein BV25DRAFT_1587939 [Artomyces pyxidatus]
MPRLPLELLMHIVDLVPTEDLLPLRGVSWLLCAIATPRAFRVLRHTNTLRSTIALSHLLETTDIRQYVQEVHYTNRPGLPSIDELEQDRGNSEVGTHLFHALQLLPQLPVLHTLSLNLAQPYNGLNGQLGCCSIGQLAAVDALAQLDTIPTLRSLTLDNIFLHDIYSHPRLPNFLCGLTHLRLSAIDPLPGLYSTPVFERVGLYIQPLLRAAADTLVSLTLHFQDDTLIDLAMLRYPHLEHLSLQNVVFCAETGAEAFVLAHAPTLVSLSLTKCKTLYRSPRGWAQIYDTFSEGLGSLREVAVEEDWAPCAWSELYPLAKRPARRVVMYAGASVGYCSEDEGEDVRGLDRLTESCRARASSGGLHTPTVPAWTAF